MSAYYKINGMKVRVSDHEPNFSMERIRGRNDVEFYTKTIENKKISVISQIEYYCDKNNMDPAIFSEIANDFPDDDYVFIESPKKIEITEEILNNYLAISGRNSMKKKEKYCQLVGVNSHYMSQGYYTIKS